MSEFYTDEELEIFGGSTASDDLFQPSGVAPGMNDFGQPSMQQGIPFEQGMQSQIPENAPQFIKDMQDPSSKTYKNVHMGASIANAIRLIIFGLVFAFIPFTMIFSVLGSMKADGAEGMVIMIPMLMIVVFVSAGIGVLVRGIRELIRAIKNK